MKKLILVSVVALLTFAGSVSAGPSDYLSYDDFIRAVEAGHIKSVALDEFSSISGTQVLAGVEKPFSSYTHFGAANDPLLLRLLKDKGVPVTVAPRHEDRRWVEMLLPGLLMLGVPIITLVFVILIYRRLRGMQPPMDCGGL